MPEIEDRNRLLSVAELQVRLGLSQPTIYRMMDRGELGFIQLGRSRRVRPDVLEEFLRKQTHGGAKS